VPVAQLQRETKRPV